MKRITYIALLLSMLVLVGCNTYLPFERKLKVQQGNIVTPHMVAKVKYGMTKQQVSFILGTAVLESTFASSRWDYVYTYQVGNDKMELRRVSIFFNKYGKVRLIQRMNNSGDKHTIPVAHSKKTEKAARHSSVPSEKMQNARSQPSASGKPRARGTQTSSQGATGQ